MVRGLSILLTVMLFLSIGASAVLAEKDDFGRQRQRMVTRQLRARGISGTRVLNAMRTVPRHLFVPENLRDSAYADTPLPIGYGQTISQPYIVALMSEVLALEPGERVLEIGTGSGYQAAILAEMGALVFTIEIDPQLADRARTILQRLEYETIRLKTGDGYRGWPEAAPFDAIIVTCAPEQIPEPLKSQLAEGGRMVIPVGERLHQRLMLLTKQKGEIREHKIVDVHFVPMVDTHGKPY
mgnify:CR=1 FL=1